MAGPNPDTPPVSGVSLKGFRPNNLLSTLKSTMVVRTPEEVLTSRALAAAIENLKFLDDDVVGRAAIAFSERLYHPEIIRFDVDEFGNPLLTRRERTLIVELVRHLARLHKPRHRKLTKEEGKTDDSDNPS